MEVWYRGWLCYFPIVSVLFIVCFQILPTVKQQETVHKFVTHTYEVSTNDFESRLHFERRCDNNKWMNIDGYLSNAI